MKIALTGGRGTVGRAVAEEALHRGYSVVSIDRAPLDSSLERSGLQSIVADVGDYDALVRSFAGCDALIHMAAIPKAFIEPDHIVHNNNVVGSYNALRAAVENGITRVCQASSVNAIGLSYSRVPRFDYFPIDEAHPTYDEDPYSLSKWICEQQADSFARRYSDMQIASLRLHWIVPERSVAHRAADHAGAHNHLWGYTRLDAAVRASLLSLEGTFSGHDVFYIVASDSLSDIPSIDLAAKFHEAVPVRGDLSGNRSFFNSTKANRLLNWTHDLKSGSSSP